MLIKPPLFTISLQPFTTLSFLQTPKFQSLLGLYSLLFFFFVCGGVVAFENPPKKKKTLFMFFVIIEVLHRWSLGKDWSNKFKKRCRVGGTSFCRTRNWRSLSGRFLRLRHCWMVPSNMGGLRKSLCTC